MQPSLKPRFASLKPNLHRSLKPWFASLKPAMCFECQHVSVFNAILSTQWQHGDRQGILPKAKLNWKLLPAQLHQTQPLHCTAIQCTVICRAWVRHQWDACGAAGLHLMQCLLLCSSIWYAAILDHARFTTDAVIQMIVWITVSRSIWNQWPVHHTNRKLNFCNKDGRSVNGAEFWRTVVCR